MTHDVRFEHYRVKAPNKKHKGKPSFREVERYFRGNGDWKPSPRGGITFCQIFDGDESLVSSVAYCSHSDNFDYKIGRKIALGRALAKLEA